jgi:hypothetical protein
MPFDRLGEHTASYKRSVSTTWEWRKVKIEPAARPRSKQPAQPATGLARGLRRPAHFRIKYRGGSEAWWELSDGRYTIRIPGHICLHDALMRFYELP